jgi:hypothetical protein
MVHPEQEHCDAKIPNASSQYAGYESRSNFAFSYRNKIAVVYIIKRQLYEYAFG